MWCHAGFSFGKIIQSVSGGIKLKELKRAETCHWTKVHTGNQSLVCLRNVGNTGQQGQASPGPQSESSTRDSSLWQWLLLALRSFLLGPAPPSGPAALWLGDACEIRKTDPVIRSMWILVISLGVKYYIIHFTYLYLIHTMVCGR